MRKDPGTWDCHSLLQGHKENSSNWGCREVAPVSAASPAHSRAAWGQEMGSASLACVTSNKWLLGGGDTLL